MTTFKEIRGKLIRTLDTDPTPAATYEGQIWYNKTIGVLKGSTFTAAAWSSAPNLPVAKYDSAGAGTTNAALSFAGISPPSTWVTTTEEYDGTSWTAGGAMNAISSSGGGFGIQTAAVGCGGYNPQSLVKTEEYNGSAWTSVNNMTNNRQSFGSAGILTAGLAVTNASFQGPAGSLTEEYDGTNWTSGGTYGGSLQNIGTLGTQTASVGMGGVAPPSPASQNESYEYNGSAWTAGNPVNTAGHNMNTGDGTSSSGIWSGGSNRSTSTEQYDGTSWATSPATIILGRARGGSTTQNSDNSSQLIFAGRVPSFTNTTEQFTDAFTSTKTLTTS